MELIKINVLDEIEAIDVLIRMGRIAEVAEMRVKAATLKFSKNSLEIASQPSGKVTLSDLMKQMEKVTNTYNLDVTKALLMFKEDLYPFAKRYSNVSEPAQNQACDNEQPMEEIGEPDPAVWPELTYDAEPEAEETVSEDTEPSDSVPEEDDEPSDSIPEESADDCVPSEEPGEDLGAEVEAESESGSTVSEKENKNFVPTEEFVCNHKVCKTGKLVDGPMFRSGDEYEAAISVGEAHLVPITDAAIKCLEAAYGKWFDRKLLYAFRGRLNSPKQLASKYRNDCMFEMYHAGYSDIDIASCFWMDLQNVKRILKNYRG